MSDKTGISWTDATWNPIAGCSLVSPGCTNCYAMKEAHRLGNALRQEKYRGLTKVVNGEPVWTGDVRLWPAALDQPLRWKRPRRIFVNSMSDLFHEELSFSDVAAIFGVMAAARQHTFQILTKRPENALRFFDWLTRFDAGYGPADTCVIAAGVKLRRAEMRFPVVPWPLKNVWLGVSAEDQQRADERIPLLLQTPAAVRFVSAEPLLGPIDLSDCFSRYREIGMQLLPLPDWVITGGESGPRPRSSNESWFRSILRECRSAGVAFFMKQYGALPLRWEVSPEVAAVEGIAPVLAGLKPKLRQRAGADPSEWPEDLRVQQFPGEAAA